MHQYFKDLITHRALAHKLSACASGEFAADLIENDPVLSKKFKNVCAPIPLKSVKRLENVLKILRIKKQEFLTAAIFSALDDAEKIMADLDIDAYDREIQLSILKDDALESLEIEAHGHKVEAE